MEQVLSLALLGGLLVAAITLIRPKPSILIAIEDGKAKVKKGKVSRKFLEDCQELCTECKVQRGKISAYGARGRISLRLSSQIPADYHQRF